MWDDGGRLVDAGSLRAEVVMTERTLPVRPMPFRRLAIPAAVFAIALSWLVIAGSGHPFSDVDAYWNAGLRLREGDPLYRSDRPIGSETYLYAPWFAVLWVPLTFLPQPLVFAVWGGLLIGAAAWSLMRGPIWLSAGVAPFLLWSAVIGNVQSLMIAGLLYSIDRGRGSWGVGLAASLKVTPILLTLVFLGRREWKSAAIAGGVAVALWLPAVPFVFSDYPTAPGLTYSLLSRAGPVLFVAVAAVASMYCLYRPSWFSGSFAVLAALPRLLLYDFSYLLLGSRPRSRPDNLQRARSGSSDPPTVQVASD
jgi:hypothetical protein